MKKKKLFKTLPCLALSALMALSAPAMVFAGPSAGAAQSEWVSGSQGWWWKNPDGTWPASAWKQVKGLWYHFGPDGYINLGWYQDADGTWYYLDPANGDMKTGWANVNGTWYYLDPAGGAMQTGWKNVGGYYYYLDSTGAMWHDTTTPDGYQVNHDGVWVEAKASSQEGNTGAQSSGSSGEIKDGEDGWHKTASGWYKDGMGGTKLSYYDQNRKVLYMFNSSGYLDSYKMWDGGTDLAGQSLNWIKSTDPNVINGQTTEKANTGTDDDAFYDSADTEQMAKDLIGLINKERKKAGRSSLKIDDKLMEAAQIRAEEASEKFSHTRPDGSSCFTVVSEVGFDGKMTAENLTSTGVFGDNILLDAKDHWMLSPGHKQNILSKRSTKVGAAIVFNKKTGVACYAMVFGK